MANKPTADETPADNLTPDRTAPAVVAESQPVVVATRTSNKARWALTAIAGAGLVGLGLLGGILIGQQVGLSTAHDLGQAAHLTMENQQSGQREKLREHVRERLQEMRDGRQQSPGQQSPGQQGPAQDGPVQPSPTPTPGNNG